MFNSLGRATFEQDAFRLRPLLNSGVTPAGAANTPEWVPVVYGYNVTDGTAISLTSVSNTTLEIILPADKQALGLASFVTPKDYTGDITINSVVYIGFNQTMRFRTNIVGLYYPEAAGSGVWDAGSPGGHATDETITSDFSSNGWYTVGAQVETINQQTVIWTQCVRLGTHADDTSSASARHYGFYIQYG